MAEEYCTDSCIIFNIQHYCIHDGPGIRTNIFVKGCPLRCAWCANPESQDPRPQLMYRSEKCTACGKCVAVCPQQAIYHPNGDPAIIANNRTLCTACGACASVCPNDAREIAGKEITPQEAYEEVSKDILFYGEDGGLTVTGGEALAFPNFTKSLMKLCKEGGITTAVETCGAVGWEVMQPVLEYTDTVLYDIKHMDSQMHKQYTGIGNEGILANLERISSQTNCSIIVRCPIIPGVNDTPEDIRALADYLVKQNIRCSEINLLPYHNMGEAKRVQLEPGEPGFLCHSPAEADMEILRNILRSHGFLVK